MNSLLIQMIAARAGSTGNTVMADALARIRSSSGSMQDPQELLAQLGNSNPLLSALSSHLAGARSTGAGRHQPPVIDAEPEETKSMAQLDNGQQEDPGASLLELREQVEGLLSENKDLKDRCESLASTLGACCLCWGRDPGCRACRGRGRPGYAMPDEALFSELVLPAIRMMRACRANSGGASVAPPRKAVGSSGEVSDHSSQNERTRICQ
jgi:hypothetical protein